MNIRQFEYVLSVAENKHFELAAEKCFVSQSTLSTMISKFEEEIGIKVFNRKKKPVEITAEGEVIIQQLRSIHNHIEYLTELTREIKGEVGGNLNISVIPTVAPFLLPVFLQDFALKFPKLHTTVKEETTAEIIRQLKSRELDIGIISIPVQDNEITEIKLYDEPFLLYDVGKKSQKNISIKKLDMDNLWLMEEGHCMRTQVLEICDLDKKITRLQANFEFKAGSIDSLIRFVKANKAKTLLPLLSTYGFSEKDKKHLRNFETPVPLRTIGLAVHQNFAKKKVLSLLKQEIIEKTKPLLPARKTIGKIISPV